MHLDSIATIIVRNPTEKIQNIFNRLILLYPQTTIFIQLLIKFNTNNFEHTMLLIVMILTNIIIRTTTNLKFHQRQQKYILSYFLDDTIALNKAITQIGSNKFFHRSCLSGFLPKNNRYFIKFLQKPFELLFTFVTSHMMNILFRGQEIMIKSVQFILYQNVTKHQI